MYILSSQNLIVFLCPISFCILSLKTLMHCCKPSICYLRLWIFNDHGVITFPSQTFLVLLRIWRWWIYGVSTWHWNGNHPKTTATATSLATQSRKLTRRPWYVQIYVQVLDLSSIVIYSQIQTWHGHGCEYWLLDASAILKVLLEESEQMSM